jgi:hypothetical protein
MDAESIKFALSVLSAVVAVSSAILAYRTRRQTRQDIFETQRDLLLLTMSENDIRLKTLEFRASLLRTRLVEAVAAIPTGNPPNTPSIIDGLTEVSAVARDMQRRDWTQEQVRLSEYSEESLLELRRRILHEQVISRTLQVDAHSALLDEAQAELAKITKPR